MRSWFPVRKLTVLQQITDPCGGLEGGRGKGDRCCILLLVELTQKCLKNFLIFFFFFSSGYVVGHNGLAFTLVQSSGSFCSNHVKAFSDQIKLGQE